MSITNIKIGFWGTPELTRVYLDALHKVGMTPIVIITNPDRPKGRGQEFSPTPAKEWALEHNIPVLQPEKLDDAFFSQLSDYKLDLSIVVAYGSIMPERFIELPKYKTLNVHYSLLPKYRGAAPTEAAILAGDTETGSAIQLMAPELDSGPLVAQKTLSIGSDETTTDLRARLTTLGAKLLVDILPDYLSGKITPTPQSNIGVSHFGKIKKETGLYDPSLDPLTSYRKFRAYVEYPRTYFFTPENKRVIITEAHLENGSFVIDRVLPEGKKEISYADFMRGNPA